MNFIDKAVSFVNPVSGAKRVLARKLLEKAETIYSPQSRTDQTKNYNPRFPTDPNFQMSYAHKSGQQRSLGLYFDNPIAKGIINAMVDGALGNGLTVESAINYKVLGMTAEQVADIQQKIEWYWDVWANDPMLCDHYGKQTFGSLQREAYINALSGGDVLQHIKISRTGKMYLPQVQNIPGQNVKSPHDSDSKQIAGGVEVDNTGRETAYHMAVVGDDLMTEKIIKVNKYSTKNGRIMYNLVLQGNAMPGQRRGRSILLTVNEQIIQLGRYSEAELTKSIIQSFLTLFIEKSKEDEAESYDNPLQNLKDASKGFTIVDSEGNEVDTAAEEKQLYNLGPGLIWDLPSGHTAKPVESTAPVAEFWKFMEAQLKLIGMAVNIPYEVLIKSFNSSYSASQASIQDAARGWKIAGGEWAYRYCQPVYDQFVEMLVRLKVIDAPGFFDNPIIRNAWCRAKWRGPAMLHVDPRKSVESYINAINNNLITRESASQALYGEDWDIVNDRNAQELQKMRDRGVGINDKGYIKLINEAEDDDGNPIGGNQ